MSNSVPSSTARSLEERFCEVLMELFDREVERRGVFMERYNVGLRNGGIDRLLSQAIKNAAHRLRAQQIAHHDHDQNLKGEGSI